LLFEFQKSLLNDNFLNEWFIIGCPQNADKIGPSG